MDRILFILGLFVIAGCSPRIIYRTEIEHSTDTVVRERILHDTATFYIDREVEKVIVRDSVSHLENQYAKSDASIDTLGFLHHSLESKPQIIYVPVEIPVADTTVREKSSKIETTTVQVEKPLTRWQRFQLGGFWAFLAALVAAVCLKFNR